MTQTEISTRYDTENVNNIYDFMSASTVPEETKAGSLSPAKGFQPNAFIQSVAVEHGRIIEDLASLHQVVTELQDTVQSLKGAEGGSVDVIEIRELSDEDAKVEVVKLFEAAEGHVYYSDIEEKLFLDIEQVIRVCDILMEEGKIAVDEID